MKHLIASLLTISILVITTTKSISCDKIENGKYQLKYKNSLLEDFVIIINGNQYTFNFKDGKILQGRIIWESDCLFAFTSMNKSEYELDSRLNGGRPSIQTPYIELLKRKGKVIFFRTTYLDNLSSTSNEGKLIKLKEK